MPKNIDHLAKALAYLERVPTATARVPAEAAYDNFRGRQRPLLDHVKAWAEKNNLSMVEPSGADTIFEFRRKP